jgi:hypothetical protein
MFLTYISWHLPGGTKKTENPSQYAPSASLDLIPGPPSTKHDSCNIQPWCNVSVRFVVCYLCYSSSAFCCMQNLLGGPHQTFLKLQSQILLMWRLVGVLVSFVKRKHFLSRCSGKLRCWVCVSTDRAGGVRNPHTVQGVGRGFSLFCILITWSWT